MNQQKGLLTRLGETLDQYQAERRATAQPRRWRWLGRQMMPNIGTLLLVAVLILTQNVWARQAAAPNAPGPSATTVNYQGRLSDSDGVPLDGTYGMTFALHDAATDGNLVWGPEEHTAVEVSDGLFSVGLGSKTGGGIPTTTWNGDRYLEITVGGETLEPRELLRSVPIAGMALTVPDGAITSDKLSRGLHKARLSEGLSLPEPDTVYDVLEINLDVATETLITIHGSMGVSNKTSPEYFVGFLTVDENVVSRGEVKCTVTGRGETLVLTTALLLDPGQHRIVMQVKPLDADNSQVSNDPRTYLVVVEG